MKHIFCLITAIVFSINSLIAQDIIITFADSIINVKVLQINQNAITYILPQSNLKEYTMPTSQIKAIKYKNGAIDTFNLKPFGKTINTAAPKDQIQYKLGTYYYNGQKISLTKALKIIDVYGKENENRNMCLFVAKSYKENVVQKTMALNGVLCVGAAAASILYSAIIALDPKLKSTENDQQRLGNFISTSLGVAIGLELGSMMCGFRKVKHRKRAIELYNRCNN